MRVDVPRPLDLTLPTVGDDVVQLYAPWSTASDDVLPGNVDVAGPAYDPASLTVLDIACASSASWVVVPRPAAASVHKPMSAVGVRPPKSSVPIDVVEPSSGPAPLMRVDNMGQQCLGRSTSVDVASYPGLPSASVDVVCQPHSSFMGADVVRPTPTRADVVHPSSMGADAARPMTIGGVHPPSLGAGVVGPMPTHVAYPPSTQIGSGVDVALRTSGPTLADARSDIPRPRPAHASQYAAVCTGVQVQTPVETLTAHSLLLLGRRTVSPESSPTLACMSGCRLLEQLHPRLARPSLCHRVATSCSRYLLPVLMRQWSCRPPLVRRVCRMHLVVV